MLRRQTPKFVSQETLGALTFVAWRGAQVLRPLMPSRQKPISLQTLDLEVLNLAVWRGAQVLRPFMLRRTKAEVETELPGKAEHIVRCGLSAWQRLWYRQITEEVRREPRRSQGQELQAVPVRASHRCALACVGGSDCSHALLTPRPFLVRNSDTLHHGT